MCDHLTLVIYLYGPTFPCLAIVAFQSAAVGTACAGQLYFSATFAIAVILTLLRFGPRQQVQDDDDEEEQDYQAEFDMPNEHSQQRSSYQSAGIKIETAKPDNLSTEHLDPEAQPLNASVRRTDASTAAASIASGGAARRRRSNAATLGGIL